jgi:hypothetical protein
MFKFITITFALLIGLSTASANFKEFMQKVNSVTGISKDTYSANVKKAEMLGYPNQTLFEIYSQYGMSVFAHSEPSVEKKELSTTTTVLNSEVVVNSLKTQNKENTINIDSLQVKSTELVDENNKYKANIESLEAHNRELARLLKVANEKHISLQVGDILIADKNYKKIQHIRTKRNISGERFDKLYEDGIIAQNKNKQWIVVKEVDVDKDVITTDNGIYK